MFGVNSIIGSVKWLGVPAPLSTYGPPWADNILANSLSWGTGFTSSNPNWGIQPGGPYGSFSARWNSPVRAMPAYVRRSLENTRSAVHCVCDNLLRENCTSHMQMISTSHIILRDCLVNRQDCNWDDLWEYPVYQ